MGKGHAVGSLAGDRERSAAPAPEKNPKKHKPPFTPAPDDTKPLFRDPILRSDPIETEQAVLRLPPFPKTPPTSDEPKCCNATRKASNRRGLSTLGPCRDQSNLTVGLDFQKRLEELCWNLEPRNVQRP